jgi:hypothetical protein
MTRIVRRPVAVWTDNAGRPQAFRDGERTHRVRAVIDEWREMGAWWDGETESRMWRVDTDEGVYDLELLDGQWRLYRIWD